MTRTQRWMKLAAMILIAFSLGGCGLTLVGRTRTGKVEKWSLLTIQTSNAFNSDEGASVLAFYDGDMTMKKGGQIHRFSLIQLFSRRIDP